MESDGTDISTSSIPHQLVYIRTCADNKRVVTLMIHTMKRFTQLKCKCSCLLCPCSRCVQQGHTHITHAANNAGQPCQWPSDQIHRISRGTPPSTTDPLGLPSARLWLRHHQSQRGGPPSQGQGTQQRQDGHQQHTRERHFVLSAMNDRTSSQQITTCTYIHAWYTVDDSMHPYQTPCQGPYSIHTTIHTTYIRTLQVHNRMTISHIQIQSQSCE